MVPINGYNLPAIQRMSPKVQRLIWRIGGIGLTGPELSLKVSLVMRLCDGMSGLVRGNRRKAVFAFKGLFTEGICPYPLLGSGLLSRISEVRGKSKLAAHTPIFANKIAGRKSPNPGPSRQVPFFYRTSEFTCR